MERRDFIQTAAAVAAAAAGDVSEMETTVQQDRLLALADRVDDERWAYKTDKRNVGHLKMSALNIDLDAGYENPAGKVETLPANSAGIPLGIDISDDSNVDSLGALVHLEPSLSEALAVDLLEQAHAARDINDTGGR